MGSEAQSHRIWKPLCGGADTPGAAEAKVTDFGKFPVVFFAVEDVHFV